MLFIKYVDHLTLFLCLAGIYYYCQKMITNNNRDNDEQLTQNDKVYDEVEAEVQIYVAFLG